MTYGLFEILFHELNIWTKIALYNEYVYNCTDDEHTFHRLDEQFFIDNFQSYTQLAEAIGNRGIDMNNEIVYIDKYGDIETTSEELAEEHMEDYLQDIFDHPEIWTNYIDMEE